MPLPHNIQYIYVFLPTNSDMITFEPLSDSNSSFAKKVFETSFPIDERPPFDTLSERNKQLFHFNVVYINDNAVGIFSYWTFDTFAYVEHFAVEEQYRNNGMGQMIMKHFLLNIALPQVVLEVEMPDTAMAQRRIEFYKRLGFTINPHNYIQPSYHNDGNTLPMVIMSLSSLSATDFAKVKQRLYSEVYLLARS